MARDKILGFRREYAVRLNVPRGSILLVSRFFDSPKKAVKLPPKQDPGLRIMWRSQAGGFLSYGNASLGEREGFLDCTLKVSVSHKWLCQPHIALQGGCHFSKHLTKEVRKDKLSEVTTPGSAQSRIIALQISGLLTK